MVTYCVTKPGPCSALRCCLNGRRPGSFDDGPPRLIGLYSSHAQSGKSESAKVCTEAGYWEVKFADPIKDMVRGLLKSMGFDHEMIERMVLGDLKEEVIPGFDTVTSRMLQQTLGTDWGREAVAKDLWTKVATRKIDRLLSLGGRVIIDDVRFPNEYRALRERGAYLVRVVRPDAPSNANANPRYEGLLDNEKFDATIYNEGSLDFLRLHARKTLLEARP